MDYPHPYPGGCQALAGSGTAAAIIRASPFSPILAQLQLTFSFTGAVTLAVVQTRFTSLPMTSAASDLHSHTRPSSSVTWRDDIVGTPMGLARNTSIR